MYFAVQSFMPSSLAALRMVHLWSLIRWSNFILFYVKECLLNKKYHHSFSSFNSLLLINLNLSTTFSLIFNYCFESKFQVIKSADWFFLFWLIGYFPYALKLSHSLYLLATIIKCLLKMQTNWIFVLCLKKKETLN